MSNSRKIVLGSRSPRRLELLRQIVPADRIVVLPPRSSDEADFAGVADWAGILQRLLEIARSKCHDVVTQLNENVEQVDPASGRCGVPVPTGPAGYSNFEPTNSSNAQPAGSASFEPARVSNSDVQSPQTVPSHQGAYAPRSPYEAVLTADTVIIGTDDDGGLRVLGQPPERDDWAEVVREWFLKYYFGKPHVAATAVCLSTPDGRRAERVVRSAVTFRADGARWLDWYLASGEPRGKAGGYAIQEAGSLFVEKIEGSLSNIVGLPLVELLELFDERQIDVSTNRAG